MSQDPYAEFQKPAAGTPAQAGARSPYAEFQQPAAAPAAAPEQPGFFSRLYDNTLAGPAELVKTYGRHVQENQPRYGLAAGFPAMLQTGLDVGNGITNGFVNAAHKTWDAAKQGDVVHAVQQAPGMVPFFGPPSVQAGEDAEKGNWRAVAGDVTGLGTSVAAPSLISGAGRMLKAPAPPIAETALGIRGTAKAFGATPGKAALEETRGFRPATVANSAQTRLGTLNQQLDRLAAGSNEQASLLPARDVVHKGLADAAAANSSDTPRMIAPMESQLTRPVAGFRGDVSQPPAPLVSKPSSVLGPNGQPIVTQQPGPLPPPEIAANQSPSNLLAMKRQFGKDFVDVWKPSDTDQVRGVAKQTYHALDNELDRTVPEAAGINQRTSSLIPVANSAARTSLNASTGQRILGRIARPTGALVGLTTGAIEGARVAGPFGAVAGGMTGLGLPELISSPTVQMLAARGLYGAGRGAEAAAPGFGNFARVAPLVRIRREEAGQQ